MLQQVPHVFKLEVVLFKLVVVLEVNHLGVNCLVGKTHLLCLKHFLFTTIGVLELVAVLYGYAN